MGRLDLRNGYVKMWSLFFLANCTISHNCNEKINIFGKSKIDETAAELGVPVLAKLPINPEINVLVDEGRISEIEANELDDFVELLK